MITCSRYFQLFLVFLTSFYICPAKAQNLLSPENVYDLAFSDCKKLEADLVVQGPKLPSLNKLKLAENLSKIISLKTPSNSQFPGASSATFNPKTFDVSLTLNPNSENKAKECAIKNLHTLLPESIITVPNLLSASKETSAPRFLKVLMIESARSLVKSIKEPLKDYTLNALDSEFKSNKQILQDEILIPTILPLVIMHRDFFSSLSLHKQSQALATAIHIVDPNGKNEIPFLIKHLVGENPSAIKTFALNTLSHYPEGVKAILESLQRIKNNLTVEESVLLTKILVKFSNEELSSFPSKIDDQTGETLLTLLNVAEENQLHGLIRAARELDLEEQSKLCTISLLGKEQSSLNVNQRIFLASLCSANNTNTTFINSLKVKLDLSNIVLRLVLISKNANLKKTTLPQLYKELKLLKPSIAPKEYREVAYYILHLENSNQKSNSKVGFLKLAGELISEEPIYPNQVENLVTTKANPSLDFFSSLGRQSIKPVATMLKNTKSNLLLKQGLSIVLSDTYLTYPELQLILEQLLSNKDLEIRRLAFQALLKKPREYPRSKSKNKSSKSAYHQYYTARLSLNYLDPSKTKAREAVASDLIAVLPKLKCQEASVNLPSISKIDLINLAPSLKEKAESHLLSCLENGGPYGKRSINTLSMLSNLSPESTKRLESILSSMSSTQLHASDGLKYLNLLYPPKDFPTEILKKIISNLSTNLSLKEQSTYALWLSTSDFNKDIALSIIENNFSQSILTIAKEILLSNEQDKMDLVPLLEIIEKNKLDLRQLIQHLPNITKKEIVSHTNSDTNLNLDLEVKNLFCPYLKFEDCKIAIKPSLEQIIENPFKAIKEVNILLDIPANNSPEDQTLIDSSIEYRLISLLQYGHFREMANSNHSTKFQKTLEHLKTTTNDETIRSSTQFYLKHIARTALVR